MDDKIRKDIEAACQEIASNVRRYNSGEYDYEHYVAIFEGEKNFIIGLFEENEKTWVAAADGYIKQIIELKEANQA